MGLGLSARLVKNRLTAIALLVLIFQMLCLHSATLPLNMNPFLQFTTLSLSSRLLRVSGFLVKTVQMSGITPELLLLLKCFGGGYRHQQTTPEEPISYLCPCVPYLFLTVTNGSSECRPGVNTHLQMTQIVVEDMQHSSKNLKRRTQCSREKDQNNKLPAIYADENDTKNTGNYIQ